MARLSTAYAMRLDMVRSIAQISVPYDKLGDDVEDCLALLRGRMLRRQQNGANLDESSQG